MKASTQKTNHWQDHARQWNLIRPPLRPNPDDIKLLSAGAAAYASQQDIEDATAVLFGVTPEITAMHWPSGFTLLALDYSEGMIRSVWEGDNKENQYAVQANWLSTPMQAESVNIAIADGCFTLLAYPHGYKKLFIEVHRILKKGGQFYIRFFSKTGSENDVQAVFDDLHAGKIGNFHIFKFSLAMALQKDAQSGVRLGDVWDCWNNSGINIKNLSEATGWPIDEINTINAYKDVDTRYTFPSLDEIRTICAPLFDELSCDIHEYEFSENCPSLTLGRIGS